MDFWNSDLTDASWKKLQELRSSIDFVLIGGWAIYLYTKLQKSKDIDIVIDYPALRQVTASYELNKNDRLRKYEIKSGRFDIDVYLPAYSKLTIPPEELLTKYRTELSGFYVPTPEALMTLKLGAYTERRASIKGDKDLIDILGMLFYSGIDSRLLPAIARSYGIEASGRLLLSFLHNVDHSLLPYLNLNESSFAKLRKKWEGAIKSTL